MTIERIYWDSTCFLALLKEESDRKSLCRGTINKAEKNELIIVTSAITFIEVIKLPGEKPLKKESEKTIRDFFKNSFISIRNVDREIGIIARDLMWKHDYLKPKDSIRVATAIFSKLMKLHTFDDDFLRLNNKYGDPKLCIREPDIEYNQQGELFN